MNKINSLKELEKAGIKDQKQINLIKEAFDNPNCTVENKNIGITIFVYVPSIAAVPNKNGRKRHGLYIGLYDTEICVWIAEICNNSFTDGFALAKFPYGTPLDTIIETSVHNADICDYCKKPVGLENLTRIAFCNKSCPDCETAAREKDEFPGWCD